MDIIKWITDINQSGLIIDINKWITDIDKWITDIDIQLSISINSWRFFDIEKWIIDIA